MLRDRDPRCWDNSGSHYGTTKVGFHSTNFQKLEIFQLFCIFWIFRVCGSWLGTLSNRQDSEVMKESSFDSRGGGDEIGGKAVSGEECCSIDIMGKIVPRHHQIEENGSRFRRYPS